VRLRFIAPGHEGAVCIVFGRPFPHGEWTAATGLTQDEVDRLAGNPTFEVEADLPPAKRPTLKLPGARGEELDTLPGE
jgi:hypothetical protein